MNLNSNIDVLIIGAGPKGLMLGCQLAIHNISFRIIDKTEDHTTQSNALVIQARCQTSIHFIISPSSFVNSFS